MDPNTARDQAERWLGIAVKLLTGRDLVGSRTFAVRAREADPSNPIADQILTVVDTLAASEKRVISSTNYDWYSILGLPHLARDQEAIASHYRRLLLLLNPEHNGLPYADLALRLVVDAWSALSDPTKKWVYDSELSLFLQRGVAQASSTAGFSIDQSTEPVQVDSAATFQFFQQPLHVEEQTHAQPQAQQWLYHHQSLQPQLQERQLFQQQESPRPQIHPQLHAQVPAQSQPPPPPWVPVEQPIPPEPQSHQQRESQTMQQQQQIPERAVFTQQLGGRGGGNAVNGFTNNVDDERGTHNPREDASVADASDIEKNNSDKNHDDDDGGGENNDEEIDSFWTACPYCYYMYEYPKTFQDCTLRCQNCRRGFQAVQIPNPPLITRRSMEGYFCCWGSFPLGCSVTGWKKNNLPGGNGPGVGNGWAPFSPVANSGQGVRKNAVRRPVVYIDDDDDLFEVSGSSDDSDSSFDMGSRGKKKKKKRKRGKGKGNGKGKGKGGRGLVRRKSNVVKGKLKNQNVDGAAGGAERDNPQGLSEVQGNVPNGVAGAKNDVTNMAGGSGSSRKQMGKGLRSRKKLDLNVEFSNEVEEHAPAGAGNGEEEVGFFEGLDEFLSTLPILHVVGDDKAKPS